ncbi:helix-turn-helix domain-containing protein [Alcaligenes faecalis]|nr:helix-turn-helix domain-containing protein [Alcaligenes faecalis]
MSEYTEVKIENNSILSSGYGLIPQMVARDKSISIGAKGLYSYLSSMAGATKRSCYPSRDLITHELNLSKNTFTKYLNELKKSGYIRVKMNRQDGKRYNNIYEILFDIEEINKERELQNDKELAEQRTNICDIDEDVGNKPISQCTKKEDVELCPKKLDVEICDSNSNSINSNKPYMYIGEEENKTVDNSILEFERLYEQNIAPIYPAIREWLKEASKEIDLPLFRRAIEICIENEATQIPYLRGVLRKWKVRDINTYEQLQAYEVERRKQQEAKEKKPTKDSSYRPKKNKFHNFKETFTQYSPDELDEIIRKSQREKFK